ncbi:hypothetical protein HPP92_007352 [Vanilla planifolia]|uniref:Uncharacterized protein n=1 Tax=Vanilla planifolia TaxID=51239 RepID=A0A835RG02_VANPL|nr:hypothetical protein HPP92_007352 [Vanilla planifolia]
MATFTSMAAPAAAMNSGEPAPPPPTPSNRIGDDEASSASISCFLQNLHLMRPSTPQLSLPSRLSRCVASSPSDLISLLKPQSDLLLSAATNQGLFHLADHGVAASLAASAVSEAYPLLSSSPTLADLGFGEDEEGDDDLVFDVLSERLGAIPAVAELAKSMEKVGVKVVEMLAASGGLAEDPFRTGKLRARCLIWVSGHKSAGDEGEEAEDSWEMMSGRKRYPYVVGLQYEMKGRGPWWVLDDSGNGKGWRPELTRCLLLWVT